jgi:hypothetical protein
MNDKASIINEMGGVEVQIGMDEAELLKVDGLFSLSALNSARAQACISLLIF